MMTMTVGELRDVLAAHPDETLVACTWEGIIVGMGAENVYLSSDGLLLLDSDGNYYKSQWQADGANAMLQLR